MPTKKRERLTDEQLIRLTQPPVVSHVDLKYDVYIGGGDLARGIGPSIWANPFDAKEYGVEGALDMYEAWIRGRPELIPEIDKLKGKVLGCTCRTLSDQTGGRPCHGDVLRMLYIERARLTSDEAPEF